MGSIPLLGGLQKETGRQTDTKTDRERERQTGRLKVGGGVWGSLGATGVGIINICGRCMSLSKDKQLFLKIFWVLSLQWFTWAASKILYSLITKYTCRRDVFCYAL